ncbi:MAG: hypothetical protein Q7U10_12110 [Thermodesulfovibrionia bacterium]|nr:hypothetical protein [Thermodesulfovibrionia bacterium]
MKLGKIFYFIVAGFFAISLNHKAFAWNEETHKNLSQDAVENSILQLSQGDYMSKLGYENGLNEKFSWNNKSQSILLWVREGAQLEDADAIFGKARYVNHFHNPTKEWNSAGLNDITSGMSSLLWAQYSAKQATFTEEDWSWEKIRQVYYWALISPTEEQRQINFAQTFRGLGHQMHLIQDMAQPDHVKNDAHPIDGLGWTNGLETWATDNPVTIKSFSSSPAFPQVALNVDINYEGNIYSPITQFIDTKQYSGSLIPGTSLTWGLSEYTNSNFVSDDTIFTENFSQSNKHYFPYPRYSPESYVMHEIDLPDFKKRIYLRKQGDGENIEHFATAGPLYKYLSFDPALQRDELKLDPVVHHDYAEMLIPRAAGYSAGLLNYFFRGDIDLISEGGGYVITNNSAEEMEGMFELYQEDSNGVRTRIWNGQLVLGPSGSGSNHSGNVSFPGTAGKYMLVFSGRIGNEYGAVAGRLIELYRLDIISPGNGTVTSSDGGINCRSNCSLGYLKGTVITLTAVANPGWMFSGWSAAECPGTGDCVITLNKDTAITPSFSAHLTWSAEPVSYPRYGGYVGTNGGHTSIAVDSLNRVHIGYYFADPIDRNLREDYYHAVKVNGSWSGNLLGGYSNLEYTGQYSSMTVDLSDNVYTTFLKYQYNYSLMYATNAPSGAWNYNSINGSASFGQTSIKTDSSGYVHISFSGSGQKYMTNAPSGSWVSTAIDSNSISNNYSSIAVDSFDKPHISFYSTGGLWHAAQNDQGIWSKEKIDNSGTYTSIAIDSLDNVHISYFSGSALKYATNKDVVPGYGNCPGNINWNCAVVDSSGGAYTSIALDSSDRVHISYNAGGYLKHAYGSYGLWNLEAVYTIASNSNTSIAVDSSNVVHISYKNSGNQIIHAFANLP